ncbi:MAG: helix-turn-helix domain-containing protein [Rhizobiaceae bacterium]
MKPNKKATEKDSRSPLAVTSEMVTRLQALGFTDYEARSYLSLVTSVPATAYEVSKSTGIPRPNVYNALENLTKKGAIQPVNERPARYVAVPPTELLNSIKKSTARRCEELSDLLKNAHPGKQQDVVWTLKGEARVSSRIDDMLDRATKHIWIKAADDVLLDHASALRAASRRGVKILIVLFGHDPTPFQFSADVDIYLHEGDGIRTGVADNLFTLTIDYKEALTARMTDEYIGAHTASPPVVTMAETIIRHDVYMAEIFKRLGGEVDEIFGPHLSTLRQQMFTKEQLEPFRRNIAKLQNAVKQQGEGDSG